MRRSSKYGGGNLDERYFQSFIRRKLCLFYINGATHHLQCSQISGKMFPIFIFMCTSSRKSTLVATQPPLLQPPRHSKQSSPHFRHIRAIFYGVKTDTIFYRSRLVPGLFQNQKDYKRILMFCISMMHGLHVRLCLMLQIRLLIQLNIGISVKTQLFSFIILD